MKVKLSEVYMDDEIKEAVQSVLDSGWYTLGSRLKEFESKFASFVGTKFAVGVNSGTAAIQVALTSLNVGHGDEVIVPSNTTMPTVEPILWSGATPVFSDVDAESYTLDIESVRKKITAKTKAVLPVHLYGHPARLDELKEICDSKGVALVEDCCQAHGALFEGKKVGSIGLAGCFSFYPSKNMTVCGEGGMLTTNDERIYQKALLIRHHGMQDRYHHEVLGYNFRLGEMESAVGIVQLKHLDSFNEKRRMHAKRYRDAMRDAGLVLPEEQSWAHHVYHLYVVRSKARDRLATFLNQQGIDTAIHYPVPCHLQPVMAAYPRVRLEVTERLASEILSLPMHPKLTEEQIEYVASKTKEFMRA